MTKKKSNLLLWGAMGTWIVLLSIYYWITLPVFSICGDIIGRDVQRHIQRTIRAYYLCEITGGYWMSTCSVSADEIKRMPLESRLQFYTAIMITCDMSTSAEVPLLFMIIVKDDMDALKQYIERGQKSAYFAKLTNEEQARLLSWLPRLTSEINARVGFMRRHGLSASDAPARTPSPSP